MKNIDSDLIRGNIDTIILKTMIDGDKYGLDIIKEVESRSNGTYELKQPTLYSCLKRLENQELISSYWLDSDIGGRRHYYKLTDKGRETLEKKQEEWAKSKFIIDNLLSNYDVEEYRLVKKDDYDKIIEGKQFVYNEPSSPIQNQETAVSDEEVSTNDEPVESNFEQSTPTEQIAQQPSTSQRKYYIDSIDDDEPVEDTSVPQNYSYSSVTSFNSLDSSSDDDDEIEQSSNDFEEINSPADETFEVEEFSFAESDEQSNNEEFDEDDDLGISEYENFLNNSDDDIDESFEEHENLSSDEQDYQDDRYYIHFESTTISEPQETTADADYEELPDQTQNESNILMRLRAQTDEEINTYVGDQKSYVNHLNQVEDDDYEVIQQNILDITTPYDEDVEQSINEFSSAVEMLNNFSTTQETFDEENVETIEESPIQEIEEPKNMFDNISASDYNDEFTNALRELNANKNNNGFFNSFDNPEYEKIEPKQSKQDNSSDFDYNQTDSSDASFDSYESDYNTTENDDIFGSSYSFASNTESYDDSPRSEAPTNLFDFDKIISNNASSYSTSYISSEQDSFTTFTPQYTSDNYKEKLSNLSNYSKITDEQTVSVNEEALNKAKDIESLKAEFAQEGIKVKEFKRYGSIDQPEKTYMLSNKMKMVNSMILLFAYMFILSAVYIILNNTNFKDTYGFSLSIFLYGFIPFGVYALYHLIKYMINPYKKSPAKIAPRILIFISIIITIQLLLITYCVNLQLGFYSFTQAHYNHLYWLVPTIISFAPIFANVSYIALFYSKNFNV